MKHIATLILMISLLTACQTTTAQNGATLGTLAGATIGALTFKNKITGAAVGAGAGMLVGYIVGNEMDKYDERQISNTLEKTPSGQTATWTNPDTHARYEAVPKPPRHGHDGRIERDVILRTQMPNGQHETVHAKAYRQPDGSWHLIQ